MQTWHVYILQCSNGKLYTGATTDMARRLREHRQGKGGNFTRAFGAEKIVYSEGHLDKSGALKREAELKRWTRRQKLALIKAHL